MATSSRSGEAKPTASQKIKFKQSTYESVGSLTSQTLIEYVPNGKRAGTKSAERYNVYAEARTIEQALSLGSRVPDFLNDFEKGLLRPVGGVVREPGEDVSVEQFTALSQLDKTLYNFARKARGQARVTLQAQGANVRATSKGGANAQRRAGVKKNEGGRERRNTTRKGQTGRLQMTPRKRAKMVECGLEPDGKMPQLLSGETAEIQHGRLMADAAAKGILARAEAGARITDEDILRVFRQWRFKKKRRADECATRRKALGIQRYTGAHP